MNNLKAEALLREFHYNGVRIPDPGPELTVEQVRDLLTPNYPEIATASVSGPEAADSVLRYTFSRAVQRAERCNRKSRRRQTYWRCSRRRRQLRLRKRVRCS